MVFPKWQESMMGEVGQKLGFFWKKHVVSDGFSRSYVDFE